MKDYRCYLFDADGTLIDTIELLYQCFLHTCSVYGRPVPSRNEVVGQVGLPFRKSIAHFFGDVSTEQFDSIRSTHMAYQMSIYKNHLKGFPEILETLAGLKEKRKKLGVVSSRTMGTLGLYLKDTGIYDYFDLFITPDSTKKHKPDPEPVLEALRQLHCSPEESVYIGDATYDIECGSRAGVDTVFVSWSNSSVESLAVVPTWVINRFSELL